MMPERANRTFICSVLFLDIAEYSKKPVSEQIQLKDQFNTLIAEAIRDIAPNDRIILDTGDGVAINFLGDPEDALFVAMSLRESFAPKPNETPRLPARIGINLGPVRLVRDLNGQPNIIGDGINVAQRVMGFAQPGQILVSRSYFEMVSHISEGYAKLFRNEGSRTDKHVREHEIYSAGYAKADGTGIRSPAERAQVSSHEGRRQHATATLATGTGGWLAVIEPWLNNKTIAYGTATVSVGAFALAVLLNFLGQGDLPAAPVKQDAQTSQKKSPAAGKAGESEVSQLLRPAEKKPAAGGKRAAKIPAKTAETAEPEEKKSSPLAFLSRDDEPKETATPIGTGVIALAIAPWGEVYVDGDRVGVSPPVNEVEVTPGRRKIEVRNGSFPVYTQVVEVKADQKIRIKHKFK
ncbi:MAG: adenylate/guanylate cyclase domain-containing protein [Betaproteobacteria bacterium]